VLYQVVLFVYSSPEVGPVLTGYLGVFLFAATGVSIGLFASSLTENQIIAAVITFVVLLFLFIISLLTSDESTLMYQVVQFFSVSTHVQNLLRGLINTKDLLYFGSFIVFFLFLTRRSLEAKGWR
jgi:ABC-2 type transport system permease protein